MHSALVTVASSNANEKYGPRFSFMFFHCAYRILLLIHIEFYIFAWFEMLEKRWGQQIMFHIIWHMPFTLIERGSFFTGKALSPEHDGYLSLIAYVLVRFMFRQQ